MYKKRIKELLKEKGMTGKTLAGQLNMTEVGFYKMLSESGNPTLSRLSDIARVLQVDVVDLFRTPNKPNLKCPHCGEPIQITITNY